MTETPDYRHEVKHEISMMDLIEVRQRLRAIMKPDPYAPGGVTHIRSLYFDNEADKALREKINGYSRREKFRIRYYNNNQDFIKLEKKLKVSSLGTKVVAELTKEQTESMINGDTGWMETATDPLIRELHAKMQIEGMKPKTIVDYTREPFVYGPGNVRVTFDYDIRTGFNCTDFFNWDCVTIPAKDAPILMEVKWDQFLPGIIRDAVQLPGRSAGSFSKYAQCRMYE